MAADEFKKHGPEEYDSDEESYLQEDDSNLWDLTGIYLAEEEDLISIRPKEFDDRRVTLTAADVSTLFYLVKIHSEIT